jgi:hypothetical protein
MLLSYGLLGLNVTSGAACPASEVPQVRTIMNSGTGTLDGSA